MARYIGNDKLGFIETRGIRKEKDMKLDYFFHYWQGHLFERLMRLFVYEGWMPYPQRELEKKLLRAGVAAEVADEYRGLMVTCGSLSGITEYTDVFKYVTYDNPVAKGGTLTLGKSAVVCYNNSTMLSCTAYIDRYASLLAHLDVSIRCAAVNIRAQDVFLTNNETGRDTVNEWYNKLYNGDTMAILDKNIFSPSDNIVNASSKQPSYILDLLSASTEIIRDFYRGIGVRFVREKTSNTVVDEVTNDEQLLLFNIDDMLQCRKDYCEERNRVFGGRFDELNSRSMLGYKFKEYVPLTVRLNPIFERIGTEGGNEDESTKTE